VFFIAGFAVAAWAPLIPFVKAGAGLDDGALGLLLLCFGIGSIATMPAAGALAARFGCRAVIAAATVLVCAVLPVLAGVSRVSLLAPLLFLFGAGIGTIDVTVNIQAIIVERASGRAMMSGFHGLFSFGGIAGAALVTLMLSLGIAPSAAAGMIALLLAIALGVSVAHLLPYGREREGPAFAIPRGVVLFIGVLSFILFLTEGAVLDWSAVFLTSVRGVEPSSAGLGYAAFSLTMTLGRFAGDAIVTRVGGLRVMVTGSLLAAAGFAIAIFMPSAPVAVAGFALIGAGCSNIVPVLFTQIGRQSVMPESVAVPAVTTMGYAGVLVGPALVGGLAQVTNLSFALVALAAMLIGVAVGAMSLRPS
jgi:predicted MFS family arabinose efflux permease